MKNTIKGLIISIVGIIVCTYVGITGMMTVCKYYDWIGKDNSIALIEQKQTEISTGVYTQENIDYKPIDYKDLWNVSFITAAMAVCSIISAYMQIGWIIVNRKHLIERRNSNEETV